MLGSFDHKGRALRIDVHLYAIASQQLLPKLHSGQNPNPPPHPLSKKHIKHPHSGQTYSGFLLILGRGVQRLRLPPSFADLGRGGGQGLQSLRRAGAFTADVGSGKSVLLLGGRLHDVGYVFKYIQMYLRMYLKMYSNVCFFDILTYTCLMLHCLSPWSHVLGPMKGVAPFSAVEVEEAVLRMDGPGVGTDQHDTSRCLT